MDKSVSLFHLAPEGTLTPNGPDDPLPYYYMPVIGRIFHARIEQALSLIRPPYESILEAGYGSGILLPSLARIGDSVSGIDLQSDPVEVGRAMSRLGVDCRLEQGDILDDIFPEQSFDLIVSISVLEHIRDLEPVFRQFYRLLRPSGNLLIGMPRVDKFMEKAFAMIGFADIDRHHVTGYRTCIDEACRRFELECMTHIPSMLPVSTGIYFNMLFQKRE